MNSSVKPGTRPANPKFSSGPCAKRPGWSLAALKDAPVGRSHRAKIGKARLKEVIDRSRKILGVPDDYRIGIVPASDTGAVEMAMWSLLGARGVDVAAWENFGLEWVTDTTKQLKLADLRVFTADVEVHAGLPGLLITEIEVRAGILLAYRHPVPNRDVRPRCSSRRVHVARSGKDRGARAT